MPAGKAAATGEDNGVNHNEYHHQQRRNNFCNVKKAGGGRAEYLRKNSRWFADPRRGCHRGCRWRCLLVCVCVGVRVRRSKRGLSQRVSLEVSSGVFVWGSGFADPKGGCHRGCRWRCCLVCVCVGARVRRSKRGLSERVSLEVSSGVCVGVRLRRSKMGAVTEGVVGGVVWCVCRGSDPRRGLSQRVSLEVSSGVCVRGGQASQIQDGAVTQGVVGGVFWCVCVGVRVCRSKTGLSQGVVGGVV